MKLVASKILSSRLFFFMPTYSKIWILYKINIGGIVFYNILPIIWICQEHRLFRIKSYDLKCLAITCSFIYIPNIFIRNPFLNINISVLLEVVLEISFNMSIFTLYYQWLLFFFVKLWITIVLSTLEEVV